MSQIRNITMKVCTVWFFALLIFILIAIWKNTYYIMNYWCEEENIVWIFDGPVSWGKKEIVKVKHDKAKEDEEYKHDFYYCIIRNCSRNLHECWNNKILFI